MQVGRGLQIGRQVDRMGVIAVFLPQRPGQVIVPVDQRRPLQNPPRLRLPRRVCALR